MSSERDPFTDYLARMEAVGFRPSSVLGQNFLLDPSLHRWIVDRAGPGPADTVVEIGVGLGFLTRELALRAGKVLAIEIDPRLFQIAQAELADRPNIQWLLRDALDGPGRTLVEEVAIAGRAAEAAGGRLLVVANLPYAVSGPLLAELVALDPLPARAVVLVQKELAQRVAATCGQSDHGGLSTSVQAVFTAKLLRDVPPQVFRPRPKVMSSLLELQRREGSALAQLDGPSRRQFCAFVRQLFQQRRKVLRTTLPAAARAIGCSPPELPAAVLEQRAEQVPPDTVVQWFCAARLRPQ